MQGDSALKSVDRSVFRVAIDRVPVVSELDTKLMGTTSLRTNLQPAQPTVTAANLIVQQSLTGTATPRLSGFDPTGIAVFAQPVFKRARAARDLVFYNGPVHFLHRSLAELLCQPRRRLARAAEKHHPGNWFIEPVNDAEEDVARLVVFLAHIALDRPIQGFFASLKMRARHAARLGDGQAVVVLEQDFKGRHETSPG